MRASTDTIAFGCQPWTYWIFEREEGLRVESSLLFYQSASPKDLMRCDPTGGLRPILGSLHPSMAAQSKYREDWKQPLLPFRLPVFFQSPTPSPNPLPPAQLPLATAWCMRPCWSPDPSLPPSTWMGVCREGSVMPNHRVEQGEHLLHCCSAKQHHWVMAAVSCLWVVHTAPIGRAQMLRSIGLVLSLSCALKKLNQYPTVKNTASAVVNCQLLKLHKQTVLK